MQTSSQQARAVTISVFDGARDNEPETLTISWDAFTARWGIPDLVPGTDKALKEQGEAWSPFTFNGTRAKGSAQLAGMVGLDIDEGSDGAPGITNDELAALDAKLSALGVSYAYHSTFRSGLVAPRHKLRVVVPLDRDVDLSTYVTLVDELAAKLGVTIDTSRRGDAGLFFSPRIPEGHSAHYKHKVVSRGYYQVRGPGSGLFERVRTAVIPSGGRKTLAQWCELLKTTTEKHNTLRDAAFSLAAADKERGLEAPTPHWDAFEAALKLNHTPVTDWDAAFKTYELSRDAGYDKAEVVKLEPDPLELPEHDGEISPRMRARAYKELEKQTKLAKKHPECLKDCAAAVGRFVPHVLEEAAARAALVRAVESNNQCTLSRSDIESQIDVGLGLGKARPFGALQGWRQLLIQDKDGHFVGCDENAELCLTEHESMIGVLGYSVRHGAPCFRKAPPWPTTDGDVYPRELRDADGYAAARWVSQELGCGSVGYKRALEAMVHVAENFEFDDFLEYTERCAAAWDGINRLDTWLTDYLGVEDTDFVRFIAPKVLLAAVARGAKPDCQCDNVLVLIGKQGAGKSQSFRALFERPYWFSGNAGDISKVDAYIRMASFVMTEMAELTAVSKKDANEIKEFITNTNVKARASYDRLNKPLKRRGIIVGSTNEFEPLNDPTGARRFWPVEVGTCKVELLRGMRDLLWGEAHARYVKGERWWLEGAEIAKAEEVQADRTSRNELCEEFLSLYECLPMSRQKPVAVRATSVNLPEATVFVHEGQMDGTRMTYVTARQVCEMLNMDPREDRSQKLAVKILRECSFVAGGDTRVKGRKVRPWVAPSA